MKIIRLSPPGGLVISVLTSPTVILAMDGLAGIDSLTVIGHDGGSANAITPDIVSYRPGAGSLISTSPVVINGAGGATNNVGGRLWRFYEVAELSAPGVPTVFGVKVPFSLAKHTLRATAGTGTTVVTFDIWAMATEYVPGEPVGIALTTT